MRCPRCVPALVAGAALVAAWPVPPRASGVDLAALDAEIRPCRGAVHVLVDRGGNIGVSAGDDGILLVDSQFDHNAATNEQALAELADGRPVYLVNTHWHSDHTGGNAHFGGEAVVVAHANVRRRLVGDETIAGRTNEVVPPARALPEITFEDALTIHFNGEEVALRHLGPGHTDGDVVVWFRGSNVVHLGDQFFSIAFPFVDMPSGGSVRGLIGNVSTVLEWIDDETVVIPGHGPTTDRAGLEAYRDMLAQVLARVERHRAEGGTLQEAFAAGLVDDLAATWEPENAFVNRQAIVQLVWESLEREAR